MKNNANAATIRWMVIRMIVPLAVVLILSACSRPQAAPVGVQPTLADFWAGRAEWVLDVPDTGLPPGESDTIYMGDGEYWSYLHASTASAGVLDSCGDPVEFPGCVTRWVSVDGGRHFALSEPRCLLSCATCPCTADDQTAQQQYPRVARLSDGTFIMVYENGAIPHVSQSPDGLSWSRPWKIPETGIWTADLSGCPDVMRINPHPFDEQPYDCFAGGPPGLLVADGRVYVFVGLGQNPGSMGCVAAASESRLYFRHCATRPLFSGAPNYGPLSAGGVDANPYFDFRYLTSADVVASDGYYYMAYEGIRGPSGPQAGGDDQFALGFARGRLVDGRWEPFPGNPVLGDVGFNWGVGHADLLIVDGRTVLYTATPDGRRGRYVLAFAQ
jgi:hypothetical protein